MNYKHYSLALGRSYNYLLRPKSFTKFNQVLQEFEIYKTKYKCLKGATNEN